MLKICLHWRQEDFLQTRVSKPTTWEMHIWPTVGLWERSNQVNIQFLTARGDFQIDVVDPSRLRAEIHTSDAKQKFKLILTRQNSKLYFTNW